MSAPRYPGARFIRSPETAGLLRDRTLGIVIHWTAGREPGDVSVLSHADPRSVNVQFYCPRDGQPGVYQFTETDERANHGYFTANHNMIGIECEGSGEAWTDVQFDNIVDVTRWLCTFYDIPLIKCDPSGHNLATFRGICGHRDLSVGGVNVDGNNHTDTVPDGIGWDRFLAAVRGKVDAEAFYFEEISWLNGGGGPGIIGPKVGYSREKVRDEAVEDFQKARPGIPVSTLKDVNDRYFALSWGPPSKHGEWFRSSGFADEAVLLREKKKREIFTGRTMRRFKGKQNSLYPWPG